jgi:hypothetical protein
MPIEGFVSPFYSFFHQLGGGDFLSLLTDLLARIFSAV